MRRVLCVEDHEDTRDMLDVLLGREGYSVTTAGSAALGLALARNQPFDLFVIDLWLPDGDGHQLCRRLKELDGDAPVVVYSGAATGEDRKKALLAGADAFVAKPEIHELVETVKHFLNR